MFLRRAIQFTLLIFISAASAKEGFSSNPQLLPEGLQKVWNATFAYVVTAPKMYIGTAFLIYKDEEDGELNLLFLTADHNIQNCKPLEACPNLSLMQDADFRETPKTIQYRHRGLRFDRVIYMQHLEEPKLALLGVVVKIGTSVPEPVRLANSCEIEPGSKLYTIGWPYTPNRKNPALGTIENPSRVLKRWSEGIYLGNFRLKEELYPFFGTTIDSITGNSGGPIATEDGTVVTISQKAATAPGDAYTGVDDIDKKEYQTLGSHCEFTRSIRKTIDAF